MRAIEAAHVPVTFGYAQLGDTDRSRLFWLARLSAAVIARERRTFRGADDIRNCPHLAQVGLAVALLMFAAACITAPLSAPASTQALTPAAPTAQPKPAAAVASPTSSAPASLSAQPATKPAASPAAVASPSPVAALQPTPVLRTGSDTDLILTTTTSTHDSGLLDVLIPLFQQQTGYQVKTISVGTGAALALGARGEADVVLVHAPASEAQWMQQGNGTERLLVMHNDFCRRQLTRATVVTDGGTLAAHASLVAREYGIPAVVGTGDATRRLRTGQMVSVDGSAGTVEIVEG